VIRPDTLDFQAQPPVEPETPLEWALFYAVHNYKVFPIFEVVPASDGSFRCACNNGVNCPDAGKHPRTYHGFHEATTGEAQIRRWWSQWPNANIGIRTGDGQFVLDVDVDKGGDESLELLEAKHSKLPETRQALTGSGGRHHWFQLPDGVQLGCTNGFEYGLDTRSDSGYVVVEPSVHRSGNIYRWDGIAGFNAPVAGIPRWLLDLLAARRNKTNGEGEPWRQLDILVSRRPELPQTLLDYMENDAVLSQLWNLRRADFANPKTGAPNFSAYDLALASHFIKAGVAAQEVADILTAFRLKHGNPKAKGFRLDYLKRTIYRAQGGGDFSSATKPVELQPGPDREQIHNDPPIAARPESAGSQDAGDPQSETKESESANEPQHPYREIGGCIFRVKAGKDNGEEYVPLTNFTARITSDLSEDDGVETRRFFGIDATVRGKPHSLIVPASRFAALEWPITDIGPNAVVHPNQKDWARAAIQSLSTNIQASRIYVHTGWRRVGDSMVYLHGGGAIGARGAVSGVDVRLSGALTHYALILPPNHAGLVAAVRASLQVLDVASNQITCALLAAVYRAAVRSADFAVWLGGPTGVFKSELAALAQQHYGAAMNARRLPANFASTGNALEALAFIAKDALLVIDDFAPQGGVQDIARYHGAADRILRACGNNQGRGRLSSDARLREAKPPRGLILATGEDMPRGQSIRGRTLIIEVGPGDVRPEVLTERQVCAASGMYAASMGGFVQWLAGNYEATQSDFQQRVFELRSRATRAHSRTPGIVADLYAGFELFLEFAIANAAITASEQQALGERCWTALNAVAKAQRVQQDASEPAGRFLELLRAAILSGEAHVDGLNGGAPGGDGEWGWRLFGSGEHERFVTQGKCVGWLDGANLYLEPTASFGAAQDLGRATGEPLVVGQSALKKRLKEKGLLASTDISRETLTVRRSIGGKSVPVLHLRADALTSPIHGQAAAEEKRDSNASPEVFEC
jgi:hypothetical protein